MVVIAFWQVSGEEIYKWKAKSGWGRPENSFWLLLFLTVALSSLSKSRCQSSQWHLQRECHGRNKSTSQFMWGSWTFYDFALLFFFLSFFPLQAFHNKDKRGRSLTALSGDFLSSFLVDMAFLFTVPSECTLVQREGERESKTVHVNLPQQPDGKKKVRNASSPNPHWTAALRDNQKFWTRRGSRKIMFDYLFSEESYYHKTVLFSYIYWIHHEWHSGKLVNWNTVY